MPRKSPGARERGLGADLRAIRESVHPKLTVTEAATRMGWTKATLSMLENGKRNISPEDVAGLLAVYRVVDERRDALIARASSSEPNLWAGTLPGLPQEAGVLASYEAQATHITSWQLKLIPGLLQTLDYARAFMQADGASADEVEPRLMARLRRQQVLKSDGVEYLALIGEGALRTPVGGPKVMGAQLRALLTAAAAPNVTIRVVPEDAVHPGMVGAFVLLEFSTARPIVHVELARSAVFLERSDATYYQWAVNQVAAVSLTETESLRLVESRAQSMEGELDGR